MAELTGLVLDPYFSAPKMAWLRENVTRDGVVTTTDTWLVHQCGAFVTDAATASRSLLTGLDDVAWNSELLDLFGLTAEPLPAIVPNDAIVGTTRVFGGPGPGLPHPILPARQRRSLAEGRHHPHHPGERAPAIRTAPWRTCPNIWEKVFASRPRPAGNVSGAC